MSNKINKNPPDNWSKNGAYNFGKGCSLGVDVAEMTLMVL